MMKRWGEAIGYHKVLFTAAEALFRVPARTEPPTKFATKVWEQTLQGDLTGKTFAITGASRGIGFVLAQRLAGQGANLILLNRGSAHSDKALREIREVASSYTQGAGAVSQINCDLCDFESVKTGAAELRDQVEASGVGIDCLVLNAGLMAQQDNRTPDGFDVQMQANHLSHFLLTSLVFDLLEKTGRTSVEARVVSHSSGARHSPDVSLQEESFEKQWAAGSGCAGDSDSMAKWKRYQQSKRANLAFTYALADFIDNRPECNVKAVCAHPGATNSGLQSHTQADSWLDRFINGLAVVAGQSTEDGCLPLALASVKEGVSNGDFFGPPGLTGNAILLPMEREWGTGYDKGQLDMLWNKSNEATGAVWPQP